MSIQIQVRNKVAVNLTPEKVIVCGNGGYKVEFLFDNEWESETVKTARFVYRKGGQNYFDDVVFTGTIVNVPVLSGINSVLVGVYAGDLITSTPAVVECSKSILCGSGTHKEPTPDVYKQLMRIINTGGVTTALEAFIDNTDIYHGYDEQSGAYYTVIRVYRDRLDGTKQYPFVYAPNEAGAGDKSTYDMTVHDGWLLAINSGVFNTSTLKPDGIVIQNGAVVQNSPSETHSECKPLTIDVNGNLGYADYNADAAQLVANGIVSAVCGFMPIIVDFEKVSETEWNSVDHYTQNAQRQIIGQWGNGDYAIITCEGRSHHNSDGWTIAEAQAICKKHGLKFAYNLDGGGSTETMLGMKHINTIYENTTGRKVPTFIVFNGNDNFHKHSYSLIQTVPATCTATGKKVYECECGEQRTEILPMVSHSYVKGVCSNCGAVDENYYDYTVDYLDVEYVSANYDAYINTGLDETTLYNIEYKAINANLVVNETNKWTSGHIMSSLNTYMPFMRFIDGGNGNWLFGLMRQYKGMHPNDLDCVVTIDGTIPHTITGYWDGDQYACAIDGVQVGIENVGQAGYSNNKYYLFAYGGQPDTERFRFSGKFYYMKLWDTNGNLVRNFTTVQRKADGVYGLFDHVNNKFYRSESGTDFTV